MLLRASSLIAADCSVPMSSTSSSRSPSIIPFIRICIETKASISGSKAAKKSIVGSVGQMKLGSPFASRSKGEAAKNVFLAALMAAWF